MQYEQESAQTMERQAESKELTPREIVSALDEYIIGQEAAKKAVAVALRNRSRRKKLPPELQEEIAPKNIIMIGPTGVGKTEIARRLARLANAPFLKVEATKFTEVGYVGRDVEAMIRDLVSLAINMVKDEYRRNFESKAEERSLDRILDILLPSTAVKSHSKTVFDPVNDSDERTQKAKENRDKMRTKLLSGELDNNLIEFEIKSQANLPMMHIFSNAGMDDMDNSLQNVLGDLLPKSSKKRKTTIKEARKILVDEEMDKLLDHDAIAEEAIRRSEQMGIIFIDEIDKIAGRDAKSGPDVSREGVQRDILPIVEGSTVNTKYGSVKTDHILFISSGAFHISKPSDLIPELQGRFPIRVSLESLSEEDFIAILTRPKNSLIKQYSALLAADDVHLDFKEDGLKELAHIAYDTNEQTENIGARRLHTIMEKLLEDISFNAPDLPSEEKKLTIDAAYVKEKLDAVTRDQDLAKYIL